MRIRARRNVAAVDIGSDPLLFSVQAGYDGLPAGRNLCLRLPFAVTWLVQDFDLI